MNNIRPGRHYRFPEEIDWEGHFWFSRSAIKNMEWAELPLASQSVYPAIGTFFNRSGITCPGEKVLSSLTGMTRKTVRKGIKSLVGFSGIQVDRYTTAHGNRSRKFKSLVSVGNRSAFPFHNCIVQGGTWLHLIPAARALYPVMRQFGFFNYDEIYIHDSIEETGLEAYGDLKEVYPLRKWDVCVADVNVLIEHSGLSRQSYYNATKSLEDHNMIKRIANDNYNGWLVYLKPDKYYKAAYLNKLTREKFDYEFD